MEEILVHTDSHTLYHSAALLSNCDLEKISIMKAHTFEETIAFQRKTPQAFTALEVGMLPWEESRIEVNSQSKLSRPE